MSAGRTAPPALAAGLGADDAALAFEGFEQRGFLAADIGARPDPHLQVEGHSFAGDVQVTGFAGQQDRLVQGADGIRVLRAHIDVAFARPHGEPGDDHALDQQEGVALHQHAVGESAGVTLVGIAHHVFLHGLGLAHGAPLDARRERRAAPATQAGLKHSGDHLIALHQRCPAQALEAAVGVVVVQRQRPGDARTGKQQALLGFQVRDLLDQAQCQGMAWLACGQGVEQARHVFDRDRPETQAAGVAFQLDQRLQPVQATRTGALDAQRQLATLGLAGQRLGHLIGADGAGHRITGNAQVQHAFTSSRQPSTSARKRSG